MPEHQLSKEQEQPIVQKRTSNNDGKTVQRAEREAVSPFGGKSFWHKSNAVIQGKGGIGYPAVPIFGKKQPIQQKADTNNTGLPDNLKSGIENLSGYSMDDVKVHYNSDKPAQLQAHAYAQGTDIHLGAGQEKHLAHEAWHVVQQKQGRVKPTVQMKGKNDDKGLEKEADVMGAKALQMKGNHNEPLKTSSLNGEVSQMKGETVQLQEAGGYTAGVEAISDKEKALAYSQKMGLTEHPPNPFYIKVPAKATYKGRLPKEYVWNAIIHNVHAHNNIKSYSQFEIPIVGDSGFDDYHTIGWIEKGMLQMISVPLKSKEWKTKEQSYVKAKPKKETEKSLIEFAVGKKDGKYVGNTMDDIRKVQKLLVQVNCLAENEVDGKIGPTTTAAIIDFQNKYKLPKTGYISPKDGSLTALEKEVKSINAQLAETEKGKSFDGDFSRLTPSDIEYQINKVLNGGVIGISNASASLDMNFFLGVSVGRNVKGSAGIKFGLGLKIERPDDTRLYFTGSATLTFLGSIEIKIPLSKFKSTFEAAFKASVSGVYEDAKHFAARLYKTLTLAVSDVQEVVHQESLKKTIDNMNNNQDTEELDKPYMVLDKKGVALTFNPEINGNGFEVQGGYTEGTAYDMDTGTAYYANGKKMQHLHLHSKLSFSHEIPVKKNNKIKKYPVGLDITCSYDDIRNDIIGDNDGKYINLNIELSSTLTETQKEAIAEKLQSITSGIPKPSDLLTGKAAKKYASVTQKRKAMATKLANFLSKAGNYLSKMIKKLLSNLLDKNKEITTSKEKSHGGKIGIQWNWVDDSGYKLQYWRISGGLAYKSEKHISIPTAAGFNIDAGYEFNAETEMSLFEGLGIHTFTYISTRYNGIYARSEEEANQLWEWYIDKHMKAIKGMLKEIGKNGSDLNKQAIELVGRDEKGLAFIETCQKYAKGEKPENIYSLIDDFKIFILEPKRG